MTGPDTMLAYGIAIALTWLIGLIEAVRSVNSLVAEPRYKCDGPLVSVIIPVRLHSEMLVNLLDSIKEQECVNYEVIVVDDRNPPEESKAIKGIVEGYGFRYVRVDHAPWGWAPKAYALYMGYNASRGDVLIFIDADSKLLSPSALAVMRDSALVGGIAGFHPRFTCRTLRCGLLAVALLGVAHAYSGFHKVMDRGKDTAWFYGCCWSIMRRLYESLGGHKSVADSIVEDRDFAMHAKRHGASIRVYRGVNIVATQWHDTVSGSMNVIMRIAAKHLVEEPLKLVLQVVIALALLTSPLIMLFSNQTLGLTAVALQIATATTASRPAKLNPLYSLGYPLAGLIVPLALVKLFIQRRIEWRGWIIHIK